MNVTVIHKKTNKSTVCCIAEAARIIGIQYKRLQRWRDKRIKDGTYIEDYYNYIIYFNTYIIKQDKRGMSF